MVATSSSAACGPDWKNDAIDTRSGRPATSSWTTAVEPVGVPGRKTVDLSGTVVPPGVELARRDRHAQGRLDAGIESQAGNERGERWVSDEAVGGGDHVVRALGPEAGAAIRTGRNTHRGAIPGGLDSATRLDRRRRRRGRCDGGHR